jgi:hypothetical protein
MTTREEQFLEWVNTKGYAPITEMLRQAFMAGARAEALRDEARKKRFKEYRKQYDQTPEAKAKRKLYNHRTYLKYKMMKHVAQKQGVWNDIEKKAEDIANQ